MRELSASTRTTSEAAAAVGCEVAQIVKSLVFVAGGDQFSVAVPAIAVSALHGSATTGHDRHR